MSGWQAAVAIVSTVAWPLALVAIALIIKHEMDKGGK